MIDLKALRAKLIDLAIRGKLVEQRPEEGTAEELFTKIQEEKARLIKEKKLKKEKPLPPISDDEIPFEIPESWKWCRLCQAVIYNPQVSADDDMEVAFLPMEDVEPEFKNVIHIKDTRKYSLVKKNYSRFQNNDVLIAKITPCFQNRKSAIAVNLKNGIGAGSSEFHVLRVLGHVCPEYILLFAKSAFFINYGITNFTGTAGQQRFNGDAFRNTPFPLPPICEQKRIVEKLEAVLSVIDKAEELFERKKALNKKIREKILQMAISGRLVEQRPEEGTAEELFTKIQEEKARLIKEKKLKKEKPLPPISDDEIPFEIPESWKWERIGNVILFDVGGGTPDKSNPNFWSGKIPWMSVKDFANVKNNVLADTQDHITELGLENSSSKLIDTQAIILCTRMGLGKFTKISQPTAINQDLRAIWLSENIEEKFFLYFYSAVSFNGTGTTVEGIRKQQLFNMLIPLPPLSEQKRIVAKIEELFALCDDLK